AAGRHLVPFPSPPPGELTGSSPPRRLLPFRPGASASNNVRSQASRSGAPSTASTAPRLLLRRLPTRSHPFRRLRPRRPPLRAHTPSASALSLLRDTPSLSAELYSTLAAPSHALTPASLALLLSLPSCHRLPPPSAPILSALLSKILARRPSSPVQAAGFLCASLAAGAPPPETSVFNKLLAPLARAGDLPRMTQLFSSMRAATVRPDAVTYGILVNGLCKSGRVGDALRMLDGMSGSDSDVRPDVVTVNTVVNGLCKSGRVQEAVTFVEERMRSVHGHAPD
uniref:Pentacotripeptide-repeat region of PRORP domain-containing protein n=1 Tax=Aegilops tauschii subsp. strangulata TaxID=200361 RepID=A0A453R9P5_AEGTS